MVCFCILDAQIEFQATQIQFPLLEPEINAFLQECKNEENFTYYYFFLKLIFTGLRKGEEMALQEEDINYERGIIDVNKTLLYHVENEKEDALGTPKTKNSYRKVTIDRFLIQELKQYQLVKKKYKFMLGKNILNLTLFFVKVMEIG